MIAQLPPDKMPPPRPEAMLPSIVGALSVALARAFKITDLELKNPETTQWDRAPQLFDLLL